MRTTDRHNRQSGFTLVEAVVLFFLAGILIAIGVPQFQRMVNRGRLEGVARETAMLMSLARMEAIRRAVPVVVRADYDADQMIAFVDVDGDGRFVTAAGTARGAADYELRRVTLPAKTAFWAAADSDPEGVNAVRGFTALPDLTPNAAVFEANGSIRDRGAVVFGDVHGNYLEVMVAPEATARVVIRKYNPDLPAGPDGSNYHQAGKHPTTGDQTWEWY